MLSLARPFLVISAVVHHSLGPDRASRFPLGLVPKVRFLPFLASSFALFLPPLPGRRRRPLSRGGGGDREGGRRNGLICCTAFPLVMFVMTRPPPLRPLISPSRLEREGGRRPGVGGWA